MHRELKTNLLYRWFVRLDKEATLNDSFRIALVRLRARLARTLSHQLWQDFLAQTVALAQRQFPPALARGATLESPKAAAPSSAAAPATVAHKPVGPPQVGQVTFDLTPAKARARIRDQRDNPERKLKLPRSHGDLAAYWITKKRRTAAGRIAETTLGYEVGFFSTQSGGLITGVRVREAAHANKTEFTNWSAQYRQDSRGRGSKARLRRTRRRVGRNTFMAKAALPTATVYTDSTTRVTTDSRRCSCKVTGQQLR